MNYETGQVVLDTLIMKSAIEKSDMLFTARNTVESCIVKFRIETARKKLSKIFGIRQR